MFTVIIFGLSSILLVLLGTNVPVTESSIMPLCTNWNTNISLVCNVISAGHNIMNQIVPANFAVRDCSILLATPHCCNQLCLPATSGKCDTGLLSQGTGACFCEGQGKPELCNAYTTETTPTKDEAVMSQCRAKCSKAPNCKAPAYVNDGISYVCVCYCP